MAKVLPRLVRGANTPEENSALGKNLFLITSFFPPLREILKRTLKSLAFLPVPMVFSALILGVLLFNLELNTDWSRAIESKVPSLVVGSQNTARAVLSVLIGGVITLTVFTFTQMMSLFNQVASMYSPRLLTRFTGDRALQLVMGTYLSVIILTVMVLLSIRSDQGNYVPNISVLVCIVLGIVCLVLFVFFVTRISEKIQVTNIIDHLANRCELFVDKVNDMKHFRQQPPPTALNSWAPIPSPMNGFVGTVDFARLSELADAHQTSFFLCVPRGQYIAKGLPILKTKRPLDQDTHAKILKAVAPVSVKFDDWYLPQIKILTEIAVKAMSPGINDPGTAIDVLDRLTSCLHKVMLLPETNHFQKPTGGEVWRRTYSFQDILQSCMQSIRVYTRHDVIVCRKLLSLLFQLKRLAARNRASERTIHQEIITVLRDIRRTSHNPEDRRAIAADVFRYRKNQREARK